MPIKLLLLFNVFVVLGLLALFVVLMRRVSQLKAAQQRVIEQLALGPDEQWHRVNIATTAQFKNLFKMQGFGAKGVAVIGKEGVRLLAEGPGGVKIDRQFALDPAQIRWWGNHGLGSSNLHWLQFGTSDALMVSADTGMNALQSREATADLYRRLLGNAAPPQEALRDFALDKNPASRAVLAILALVAAYAVIDGGFANQMRLIQPRLPTLLLLSYPLSIAVAILVYRWLSRANVPSRESILLCMLLGAACSGAWVPAAKRLDQALAGPAASYAYKLQDEATLQPVDTTLPQLKFKREAAYWKQFETGSTHQFQLVHGPLGLWQLDTRELNNKTREFYRNRDD
ncbi:hypothetical protein SAMN02745857_02889 [Andreprevotia lacus DSM 23236]|jgi:hypothetical protein|uniref:Uncharacterized protein n=1 Tax=Andreprevotia lacus DSM 23236 TaxID=1121001 RepID=A0A1W1XU78_9NEIS|nr:hypothetical protein [Andreprevotia lacus]SMC27513.1 hypothetical protein SAMN02745857_02889 [Andreprevotia lacus DSM 23236]